MSPIKQNNHSRQYGFSLVEVLVGLAIGLATTLVIVQVMGTFEGQKRTTGGTSDAQTNGSLGLYAITRQLQGAGFGMPIYSDLNTSLNCAVSTGYDHDADAGTADLGLFPVQIIDAAVAGGSDTIIVRSGQTHMGGAPTPILSVTGAVIGVANNLACTKEKETDVVVAMVTRGSDCQMRKVAGDWADDAAGKKTVFTDGTNIKLADATGVSTGAMLSCIGDWTETTYSVSADNNLLEKVSNPDKTKEIANPSTAGIVSIQAQYGLSTNPGESVVTSWVDAAGATWKTSATTPSVADRNRIKAIRIAIVARNGLYEKEVVETSIKCSSLTTAKPTGVCAWEGTAANPAPEIDLKKADAAWDHYRYRVFETVVPLRNIIWSRDKL